MRKLLFIVLFSIVGCQDATVKDSRTALPIEKVPGNVLKVAHAKFPDVKFDTAWQLSSGAIEVRGKNKIGKIHEVELSPSGTIVEVN